MVDATGVNAPRAVMLSVADLARRDGVSKPAVSRKVKELVAKHGLSVERDRQGRVSAVNSAQYDHLRERYRDPSKAQAPTVIDAPPVAAANESYDEALRQKTWTEAERSRLRLDEERGKLVKTTEVAEASALCGQDIAKIAHRLINLADDHAAVVIRDGANGLRNVYKAWYHRFCTDLADALAQRASIARIAREQAEAGVEEDAPLATDVVVTS